MVIMVEIKGQNIYNIKGSAIQTHAHVNTPIYTERSCIIIVNNNKHNVTILIHDIYKH